MSHLPDHGGNEAVPPYESWQNRQGVLPYVFNNVPGRRLPST